MAALFREFPFAFGLALAAVLFASKMGFGIVGIVGLFVAGLFVGAGIDYSRSERKGVQ